jgi:hypothetical protein
MSEQSNQTINEKPIIAQEIKNLLSKANGGDISLSELIAALSSKGVNQSNLSPESLMTEIKKIKTPEQTTENETAKISEAKEKAPDNKDNKDNKNHNNTDAPTTTNLVVGSQLNNGPNNLINSDHHQGGGGR